MGEIADMMIDGLLDEETGEYIGDINLKRFGMEAPGFPVSYERESRINKKERNRQWSTNFLQENGVVFESKNDGIHLIVSTNKGKIDFWPTTGKYTPRFDKSLSGRGVKNLIKIIERDNEQQNT